MKNNLFFYKCRKIPNMSYLQLLHELYSNSSIRDESSVYEKEITYKVFLDDKIIGEVRSKYKDCENEKNTFMKKIIIEHLTKKILSYHDKDSKIELETWDAIHIKLNGVIIARYPLIHSFPYSEINALKIYLGELEEYNKLLNELKNKYFPYSKIDIRKENNFTKIYADEFCVYTGGATLDTDILSVEDKIKNVNFFLQYLRTKIFLNHNENIGFYNSKYDDTNGKAFYDICGPGVNIIKQSVFLDAKYITSEVQNKSLPDGFKFKDCCTGNIMLVVKGLIIYYTSSIVPKTENKHFFEREGFMLKEHYVYCGAYITFGNIIKPNQKEIDFDRPVGYIDYEIHFPVDRSLLDKINTFKTDQLIDKNGNAYLIYMNLWNNIDRKNLKEVNKEFIDSFTSAKILYDQKKQIFFVEDKVSLLEKKIKLLEEKFQLISNFIDFNKCIPISCDNKISKEILQCFDIKEVFINDQLYYKK